MWLLSEMCSCTVMHVLPFPVHEQLNLCLHQHCACCVAILPCRIPAQQLRTLFPGVQCSCIFILRFSSVVWNIAIYMQWHLEVLSHHKCWPTIIC